MICLVQNVVRREGFVDWIGGFCHEMAAENKVTNGHNLRIVAVITGAAFDNMHSGLRIRMA